MKITYTTNEQGWEKEILLKKQGFKKIADCYWVQIFELDGVQVILERA